MRHQKTFLSRSMRFLGNMLSPSGRRGRLSILIYHRVIPEPDPMQPEEIDRDTFDWHLALLAEQFNVLPLSEAVSRLRDGTLPARAACITFDDGYADNCEVALPVLRQWKLPATFFVATGYLNGGRMWNDTIIESVRRAPGATLNLSGLGMGVHSIATMEDRRNTLERLIADLKYLSPTQRQERVRELARHIAAPLPDDLMMRTDQVRTMHNAGMEIGGHTVTHPIFSVIDDETVRREIAEGREQLESIIGGRVSLFAYPNGRPGTDYKPVHVEIVRSMGFAAAVSTAWGVCSADSDPYQLPRFCPWDRTPARFGLRMLRSYLA